MRASSLGGLYIDLDCLVLGTVMRKHILVQVSCDVKAIGHF